MLKHEDTSEAPSRAAAQIRVTPEELAAAITRLEARNDAGQRHMEGTIPIGEAVQQLGLEATPEEVLAEVQAGRQQTLTRKKRPSVGERLVLALGLVGILLGCVLAVDGIREVQQPQSEAQIFVSRAPQSISLDHNLLVGDATGKLVMLSEVGDNQPVHCTYSDGSFQQFSPENNMQLWELIKHDGKVYVRGRIQKMSPRVFLANGADVTTVDMDPAFSLPVTLPVSGFQVLPGAGSTVEFHAVGIHLDKHAWEKWQP